MSEGDEGDEGAEDGSIGALTPAAGTARALDPSRGEEAAAILAACTFEGTVDAGRVLLNAARDDADGEVYGLTVKDDLVAAFVLKKIPLALEVTALAVAPEHRRQGYGRVCLSDALRRAGRRPLVVETDEAGLPFYKACGFKLVGRRTGPGGTPRFRLGRHAPNLRSPTLQSGATRPRPS